MIYLFTGYEDNSRFIVLQDSNYLLIKLPFVLKWVFAKLLDNSFSFPIAVQKFLDTNINESCLLCGDSAEDNNFIYYIQAGLLLVLFFHLVAFAFPGYW